MDANRKKQVHDYIRRAIQALTSDDLERATAAFRNCTPEQMKQEYGQSGRTRQEILDGYQRERDLNREAKEYFDSLVRAESR